MVARDDLLEAVWSGRIVSEQARTTRINAVRKAVGDDGRAQRLIRTIPRKGFRLIGEVREAEKPATPVAARAIPPSASPETPSIAVLPFANLTGAHDQGHFADGMVEEIITALSHIRWLFVIARSSTDAYKGQVIDIRQIGQELGARYVVEGSVRSADSRVRVAAQLIDAAAARISGPIISMARSRTYSSFRTGWRRVLPAPSIGLCWRRKSDDPQIGMLKI